MPPEIGLGWMHVPSACCLDHLLQVDLPLSGTNSLSSCSHTLIFSHSLTHTLSFWRATHMQCAIAGQRCGPPGERPPAASLGFSRGTKLPPCTACMAMLTLQVLGPMQYAAHRCMLHLVLLKIACTMRQARCACDFAKTVAV